MSLIDAVTLIADNNDFARYYAITEAAQEAIVNDMGSVPPSQDAYRAAYAHGADYSDCVRVVGIAVANLLSEWLEEAPMDEWWKAILTDALSLSSADTRDALGAHYLPEPDDMTDLLLDN
ncbi:hypothetical protein FHR83_007089 [Actinoplanes campanulatus]|uniref:Uncharacterized protein n=1 Tax=Actinoplanes campanulatus TaxID=113559 RepID=A0A7W5FI61_9ACTN|nr:hypothetical protein [Actinoplanes campanulatus]MBB3099383.1 hypothetical protein [Actinoplanes campanulatus]GGN40211.1 hypothetical protein GCM10010109_69030 [Actinoplanes campanulatus]GID42408.1 hypothetical protein Aca09nite_89140 [Actinoplanes campanulatus]